MATCRDRSEKHKQMQGIAMPASKTSESSQPTDVHDKLLEALGKIDRPGDVCTSSM